MLPDRIGKLIERLEAGQTITAAELDRVAALQALDIVKFGADFVREVRADNEKAISWLESMP